MERPWIAPRYLSLFSWGRPPLPWDIADRIYSELADLKIASVGVTGSLCPSVITAVGYGHPERQINAFAFGSRWSEGLGWNNVVEDSPGMERDHPFSNPYVPVNWQLWDGATPFFHSQALFIDLPFSHGAVRLDRKWLDGCEHPLILLGFLEGFLGPDDILEWVIQGGYTLTEVRDYAQRGELLPHAPEYRLVIARQTVHG